VDIGPALDDEQVLYSGGANALIRPARLGLGPVVAGRLLPLVGLAGQEAVGGRLFVTGARIVFAAHRLNRVGGRLAIPICQVSAYRRFRTGLAVGVEVTAGPLQQRYVSWSAGRLVRAIKMAAEQAAIAPEQAAAWQRQMSDRLGELDSDRSEEALDLAARRLFALDHQAGVLDRISVELLTFRPDHDG
jgi:hypothetical protein